MNKEADLATSVAVVPVEEHPSGYNIWNLKAMMDMLSTYYQHSHSDLRDALPSLWASANKGFSNLMGLKHCGPGMSFPMEHLYCTPFLLRFKDHFK